MKTKHFLLLFFAMFALTGCSQSTRKDEQPSIEKKEGTVATAVLFAGQQDSSVAVFKVDIAGGTPKRILADDKSHRMPFELSPDHKRFIVARSTDHWHPTVYSIDGSVVRDFSERWFNAVFLDNQHILAGLDRRKDGNPDETYTISKINLDTGKEEVVFRTAGSIWSDVPFRLSPDGRFLAFHHDTPRRGIVRLDLETGKLSRVLAGVTCIVWDRSPDRAFVFHKRALELELVNFAGDDVRVEKRFGKGIIPGGFLDDRRFLIARLLDRDSMKLEIHDLTDGRVTTVVEQMSLEKLTLDRLFSNVGDGSFIVVAGTRGDMGLLHVKGSDAAKPEWIVKGMQRVGLPVCLKDP